MISETATLQQLIEMRTDIDKRINDRLTTLGEEIRIVEAAGFHMPQPLPQKRKPRCDIGIKRKPKSEPTSD